MKEKAPTRKSVKLLLGNDKDKEMQALKLRDKVEELELDLNSPLEQWRNFVNDILRDKVGLKITVYDTEREGYALVTSVEGYNVLSIILNHFTTEGNYVMMGRMFDNTILLYDNYSFSLRTNHKLKYSLRKNEEGGRDIAVSCAENMEIVIPESKIKRNFEAVKSIIDILNLEDARKVRNQIKYLIDMI